MERLRGAGRGLGGERLGIRRQQRGGSWLHLRHALGDLLPQQRQAILLERLGQLAGFADARGTADDERRGGPPARHGAASVNQLHERAHGPEIGDARLQRYKHDVGGGNCLGVDALELGRAVDHAPVERPGERGQVFGELLRGHDGKHADTFVQIRRPRLGRQLPGIGVDEQHALRRTDAYAHLQGAGEVDGQRGLAGSAFAVEHGEDAHREAFGFLHQRTNAPRKFPPTIRRGTARSRRR